MTIALDAYSEAQVRRMRILGVLFELTGQATGTEIPTATLHEHLVLQRDLGRLKVEDELKLLKLEHYVDFFLSLGGIGAVSVTPQGANASEVFEKQRSSTTERRARLRDVYLRWLYEQIEENDGSPTPDDFLATNPTFFGIPYSPADLEKVGEWLKDSAFIKGEAAWQYSGPLRPTLTAKGKFVVEENRSVNDSPAPKTSVFNTTVNGSANIAQDSQNVHQTLVQNFGWAAEAARLVEAVEQSLPALGEEIREQLAIELAELREDLADGSADPSRVRAALTSIGGFLSSTAAGTLGGVLSVQTLQLLASLPN